MNARLQRSGVKHGQEHWQQLAEVAAGMAAVAIHQHHHLLHHHVWAVQLADMAGQVNKYVGSGFPLYHLHLALALSL